MRPRIVRSQLEDGPARVKITRVDVTVGDWPYAPGAHGFVDGRGDWRRAAKPLDRVWTISLDESDDPHKGGWTGIAGTYTYAEAKERLVARLRYLTERRSTLFDNEGNWTCRQY